MNVKILRDVRTAIHGRLSAGQVVELDQATALVLILNGDAVGIAAPAAAKPQPESNKLASGPAANKRKKK